MDSWNFTSVYYEWSYRSVQNVGNYGGEHGRMQMEFTGKRNVDRNQSKATGNYILRKRWFMSSKDENCKENIRIQK